MKINELRIRNVDMSAVARIDELATEKGMSRNKYLKFYIEQLSILTDLKEMESKYSRLVEGIIGAVEINTKELIKVNEKVDEIRGYYER